MRILLDTNVVLDVLQAREPFVYSATQLFAHIERGEIEGVLCATTVTTLDYLLTRAMSREQAKAILQRLLGLFGVAAVTRTVIEDALASSMPDFEDAVLAFAASQAGAERIITRNPRDFRSSPVLVLDPLEFLAQL
ncbi:MAG: PIN domain-containing protein [Lentisphaeria bacterium]|nr:PIN domain-containing protein [Lentisphaeria bacterium]